MKWIIRPSGFYSLDIRPSGFYNLDIRPSGFYNLDIRPSGFYNLDTRPSGFYNLDIRHLLDFLIYCQETILCKGNDFCYELKFSNPFAIFDILNLDFLI